MTKDQITSAAKTAGISVKKTKDLLYWVSKDGTADNKSLIQKTGLAKSCVGLVRQNNINLDQKIFGENYLTEEEEWNTYISKGRANKSVYDKAIAFRPQPVRKYDQFFALEETAARRIALMDFYGDIEDKRILFLGDDDATSIMAASLHKAKEITVLDIDKQILKNLGSIAETENLNIATGFYDARKALPEQYRGRYDIVFTDPPYTVPGIKYFLSRSIDALDKTNPATRVYICFGNSDRAKERFLPIYEIFTGSGMMIRRVWDKFNRYEGAESIGSTSSLYMLEVTPRTKPVVKKEEYGNIYTHH